jgi:hypothetical protein
LPNLSVKSKKRLNAEDTEFTEGTEKRRKRK